MSNIFCPRCDLHVIENAKLRAEVAALRELLLEIGRIAEDGKRKSADAVWDIAAITVAALKEQP